MNQERTRWGHVRVHVGFLSEQTAGNALGQAQRVVAIVSRLAAGAYRWRRQFVVAARWLVPLARLEQLRHARRVRRRRVATGIF